MGCSNIYAANRTPPPMPASSWEALLATFAPHAAQIRLTGGEPTLYPDFFRILELATSYDAWVTIYTNGRWKNPAQFVERLGGWPNLSGLLVSLHGAFPESHGSFSGTSSSFDEVLANILLATENGIKVTLSTVLTHLGWDEIEKVVALGQQLGVQCTTFPRYLGNPLPEIEPTWEEMLTAVKRIEALIEADVPVQHGICIPQCFVPNDSKGCQAGVALVAVDPWGNVRPCNFSPTVIGSLHKASIYELWHSDAMNAWRALMPSECTTCAAYSVCHGGCRAVQELRPDGRDPLRGEPLSEYSPSPGIHELPADARPRATVRMRPESFGYALLGQGHIVPVSAEARPVNEACDGSTTFSELAARFGQGEIDLLGELWELGMLKAV